MPPVRSLESRPRDLRATTPSFSLPDLLSRSWSGRLIEHVGDRDLHGDGRFGHPRFTERSRDADGRELRDEFAMPTTAGRSISRGGWLHALHLSFELARHVVCWSRACDRNLAIVTQVLQRVPGKRFGQEDSDAVTLGAHPNAPCPRAFRHE